MKLLALAATALVGATAVPNLQTAVLKPAQVGKGYGIYARKDGFGVKAAPTLDLCGRTGYASEKLRVDRLQVNYLNAKNALGLSNEVVRYKPGGAKQALREVLSHVRGCPSTPVATGEKAVPALKFTITQLRDPKLLPGYIAVRVRAIGKLSNGKKVDQISYAVYQRFGDVLSGVYSFGPNTPAQLTFALHAAEQSAKMLRAAEKKPSGPPA
jgi:hypothetical protein